METKASNENSDACAGLAAATGSPVERHYVADLVPNPECEQPMRFIVVFDETNEDQPWMVSSELGCDTHHTLDEVLFWNLVMGGRHISEAMRDRIAEDFQENS